MTKYRCQAGRKKSFQLEKSPGKGSARGTTSFKRFSPRISFFFVSFLPLLLLPFLLTGCIKKAVSDTVRIASNPSSAPVVLGQRAVDVAMDPEGFARDVKSFDKQFRAVLAAFEKAIRGEWGKKEEEKPTPKRYVKYTQDYKSRALVDFDKGEVVVETLDTRQPLKSLREAVVTALLTPGDPQAVDLYSSTPVELGEEPYLYGEVRDHDGKFIRWEWRAGRYADYLIRNRLQKRTIRTDKGARTVHLVRIVMVKDHMQVRAARYKEQVRRWAGRYKVSRSLVYAIMQTESDFNPFAVSSAPAFGLMQIVPTTAGRDVRKYLTGKPDVPTRQFLFKAENNIQYGSVYLHMLDTMYLKKITNPISREYCVISAYNGGAGNVLRTFSSDRNKAVRVINSLSPAAVYGKLRYKHRYDETRRYLEKVMRAKKKYVRI